MICRMRRSSRYNTTHISTGEGEAGEGQIGIGDKTTNQMTSLDPTDAETKDFKSISRLRKAGLLMESRTPTRLRLEGTSVKEAEEETLNWLDVFSNENTGVQRIRTTRNSD